MIVYNFIVCVYSQKMEVSITKGKITTKLAFYQFLPTFFLSPPKVFLQNKWIVWENPYFCERISTNYYSQT